MNNPQLQAAFDELVRPMSNCIGNREFDQAIQMVDQFYNEHANEAADHAWLKNTCNSWKALILDQMGSTAEALTLYQSLDYSPEQLEYAIAQERVASLYFRLGDSDKSLAIIDSLVTRGLEYTIDQGLPLLTLYADVFEESVNQNVSKPNLELLEKIVSSLQIENFTPDISDKSKVIQTIRDIQALYRKSNKRHSRLCMELSKLENNLQKRTAIEEFIQSENIGYYKNLAKGYLNKLQ